MFIYNLRSIVQSMVTHDEHSENYGLNNRRAYLRASCPARCVCVGGGGDISNGRTAGGLEELAYLLVRLAGWKTFFVTKPVDDDG